MSLRYLRVRYTVGCVMSLFFFSSRRRHTRCALVTGVQTCALPISPRSRGDVQAIHPPRHHCWREEIVAQKKSQSIADSILVAWHDGRMGKRQTKRMTKQRRHRKPNSKAAHHRRLGECPDETHRRMDTLHYPRGDVDLKGVV